MPLHSQLDAGPRGGAGAPPGLLMKAVLPPVVHGPGPPRHANKAAHSLLLATNPVRGAPPCRRDLGQTRRLLGQQQAAPAPVQPRA